MGRVLNVEHRALILQQVRPSNIRSHRMFSAESEARPHIGSNVCMRTEFLPGSSRPDLIDSALLRPGRLDKSLLCDMPNESDRKEVRHLFVYF